MSEKVVRGRLQIRSATLDTDLQWIRDHVSAISKPVPTQTPRTDEVRFWRVEFAATAAQWRALAPTLKQRGIRATVYEDAHLTDLVARREEARIRSHERFRVLVLVGTLIMVAGLASYGFLQSAWVAFVIAGLGLALVAIAVTRRIMEDERAGY